MRIALTFLATSVLLSSLSACSATTSSRNIRTAGIVALIDVHSEAAGEVAVDTELVIGGANSNTYVILEGGDSLVAAAGGQALPQTVQGKGEYGARFSTSEGDFVVALARDVDTPANNSKGTMGPAFDLLPIDHPISRVNEALTISWSPADPSAQAHITLEGDCLIREDRDLGPDTGSVTFPAASLRAWKNKVDQTCAVDVKVSRTRTGTTDPALAPDSRFRLTHTRGLRFTSMP
jgi:hypothetical protein